jgi:hypothetical protein
MRVILALMWAVAMFGFWTAQEGRTADERPVRPKNWPKRVEGLGLDEARAKESALEKAREEIIARLRRCSPPITAWQPSVEYIQKALVAKEEPGKELQVLEQGEPAKRCILHLKRPDWSEFYRLEQAAQADQRRGRGEERMLLLARVLAGVMVLLMAAIAYVRLDDWTQGYYTRWLKVAAVSLLVALGSGLWLLS